MRNEFLRSDDLGFRRSHQILKVHVPGDKEIAFIGATEDKKIIRMRQPIPQCSYSREQRFSFCEIHRQHSQMVSDSLELRSSGRIRGEKKFLNDNRVNGEADAAIRLGGK
jgi:hypothetical protein